MCGINGYYSRTRRLPLHAAARALAHRGPDARACWEVSISNGGHLGLGHNRLSIIDLSEAANQPFEGNCGRYRMVFNGEIYNYKALRLELQALGVVFRTQSDSEVLLEAYIRWGAACLPKLDGMFAFVIFDMRDETLFLARDQFGIKPLHFWLDTASQSFAFASEVEAVAIQGDFALEPDLSKSAEFLLNGWLYEPDTGLMNIHKLASGQYALLDCRTFAWTLEAYFNGITDRTGDTMRAAIGEAVQLQAIADVPVGLFFSGGVDSTAIAAGYPGALNALFIQYPEAGEVSQDARYAGQIARALNMPMHTSYWHPEAEGRDAVIADFRAVAGGTGEPISDYTYAASRELSGCARTQGFKVMLSGMGGDELYAGYPRFRLMRHYGSSRSLASFSASIFHLLRRLRPYDKRIGRLRSFLRAQDFVEAYTSLIGYFSYDEVAQLTGAPIEPYRHKMDKLLAQARHLSPLKRAMYLDRAGFLAHNLTIADRSSMAKSLEVRVPLITVNQGAASLFAPESALFDRRGGKKPLRDLIDARGVAPELMQRPKQGFNPPLDRKIATLGQDFFLSELDKGAVSSVLDREAMRQTVRRHFSGQANETYRLWQLLYFNYWLESLESFRASQKRAA